MANEFKIKNGLIVQTIPAGTSDYDKFLVVDAGQVKYRTGAEVLSDIGAQTSGSYLTSFNNSDNYAFKTISISGQSNVVADSNTDTLTLVAGTGISLTTDATSDSITITNTGSSSSGNQIWIIDVSRDETTNLSTGVEKYVFNIPVAWASLVDIRASVTQRPLGADITIDVTANSSSVLNSPIIIADGDSFTTMSADLNTNSLGANTTVSVEITQVGSTQRGTGLKMYFIYTL